MRALVLVSVVDIVLLVAVLAYFLNRVARQLNHISATLAKVTFGVRAVETQCAAIGPAAERVNTNLRAAAAGLEKAAVRAERLAG